MTSHTDDTQPLRRVRLPSNYCMYCGREVHGDAKFCPTCGHFLDASDAPTGRSRKAALAVICIAFAAGLPAGIALYNTTAGPRALHRVSAPAANQRSAALVVEDFYLALNRRAFKEAYNLLSPARKRELPFGKWQNAFATTVSQTASVTPKGPNLFSVRLTAQDRTESGIITTLFQGSWKVIREQRAGFVLDEPQFSKVTSSFFDPHTATKASVSETYQKLKPSLAFVLTEDSQGLATGTAFCIGSNATTSYFLTNHHVVGDAGEIRLLLASGSKKLMTAKVLTIADAPLDAAIIAVDEPALPVAMLANDLPAEGRPIAVAGYPAIQIQIAMADMGLSPSVHEGTVNALPGNGQYIEYDAQTDHGNSGGPVFDPSSGAILGIATLGVSSRQSTAVQENLAIPIVKVVPFIKAAGISPLLAGK